MIYFLSINFLSFLLCGLDKWKSIHHRFRIPERVLLTLSFIGGAFGMLMGMLLFRHKTRKAKFYFVYLFCFLWIVILTLVCYN